MALAGSGRSRWDSAWSDSDRPCSAERWQAPAWIRACCCSRRTQRFGRCVCSAVYTAPAVYRSNLHLNPNPWTPAGPSCPSGLWMSCLAAVAGACAQQAWGRSAHDARISLLARLLCKLSALSALQQAAACSRWRCNRKGTHFQVASLRAAGLSGRAGCLFAEPAGPPLCSSGETAIPALYAKSGDACQAGRIADWLVLSSCSSGLWLSVRIGG